MFPFIVFCGEIYAVPAYPHLIKKVQPNGDEITLKMKGDEKIKWMESEDGYSLLYNKDRSIVYAIQDDKGDMIPSSVIAQDKNKRSAEALNLLNSVSRNMQFSQKQKETLLQIQEQATFKSSTRSSISATGNVRAICALVEFPDKPFTYTVGDLEQLMNQIGYVNGNQRGSVRDFYLENSYGKLDMVTTVVGPYRVQNNHAYYGQNGRNGNDRYVMELVKEVADFVFNDPFINPSDYDNDNDGYIDSFHILFAGYGEEAGSNEDCIWSHKGDFWPELIYRGKKLSSYSCSPELRGNTGNDITYIGVICHELCHILGAPDYYDTDGEGSGGTFIGTGRWDLMADGSWNNDGATPAHINMFQKIQFGWVTPMELSQAQSITGMTNSAENPVAYLIHSANPQEYYILENRQQMGFDTRVPGSGLLIYHVNYQSANFALGSVNNGHPQGIYPVCASSSYQTPNANPASYGNINSAGCVFGGNNLFSNTAFSGNTTPAAILFNGERLGKSITDIKQNNKLISFNFKLDEAGLNLVASTSENVVTLRWDTPETEEIIKGYNIYRNNEFILFSTQNAYRETIRTDGKYIYGISVQFENYESAREEVEVSLNWTSIESFSSNFINIYPNPIQRGEAIYFNLGEKNANAELFFYNLSGQLVLEKEINTQQNQDIINLPSGIYILLIKQGQQVSRTKLTIK